MATRMLRSGRRGMAIALLGSALQDLGGLTMHFATEGKKRPLMPLLNATPYLDIFGQVVVSWLLCEQAVIAWPKLQAICETKGVDPSDVAALRSLCEEDADAAFYDGKVKTAAFFAKRSLPLVRGKVKALQSGDESAMEIVF